MKEEYELKNEQFEIQTNKYQEPDNSFVQPQELDNSFMESQDFSIEQYEKDTNKFKFKTKNQEAYQVGLLKHNLQGSAKTQEETIFAERMNALKEKLKDTELMHVPGETALMGEYKSTFRSRLSDRSRAKKQNNKRSRLYKKKENASLLAQKSQEVIKSNYAILAHNLPDGPVDLEDETLMDLSAFMSTENISDNEKIVKNYASGEKDSIQTAMYIMAKSLMEDDVSDIRLDNDKALVDNAKRLERLSAKVAAFDRLNKKHGYLGNADEDIKEELEEKLDKLRAVANYYYIRKDIITDPLYMKHYNDELSMDFTATRDPAYQELAKKLLRAYVMGVDLLEKNGLGQYAGMLKKPVFENQQLGDNYISKCKDNMEALDNDVLAKEYNKSGFKKGAKDLIKEKEDLSRLTKDQKAELSKKVLETAMDYQGEWHTRAGYKDEGYKPAKVPGMIADLMCFDISDLKVDSYRQMVIHAKENYALCEKVDRLWYELARALDHGYENEMLDDKTLMELRAKCNTVLSIKRTIDFVHNTISGEPECLDWTNEQWQRRIAGSYATDKQRRPDYLMYEAYAGDQNELYNTWLKAIAEEDATKEECIKAAYPHVTGIDKMSEDELKKRAASFNKNAIIQDYVCKDDVMQRGDLLTIVINTRSKEEEERKEKEGAKKKKMTGTYDDRIFGAMIVKRSREKLDEARKLAKGSPQEQMKFFAEALREFKTLAFDEFQYKKGGSILDKWHLKLRISNYGANLNGIGKCIKNIIDQNPDLNLTEYLPEGYATVDDLLRDVEAMYYVSQDFISAHTGAYAQNQSSKYTHGFSLLDMGSLSRQARDAAEINSGQTDPVTDSLTGTARLCGQLAYINMPDKEQPGGVFNLHSDINAYYKRRLKMYDEKKAKEAAKAAQKAKNE